MTQTGSTTTGTLASLFSTAGPRGSQAKKAGEAMHQQGVADWVNAWRDAQPRQETRGQHDTKASHGASPTVRADRDEASQTDETRTDASGDEEAISHADDKVTSRDDQSTDERDTTTRDEQADAGDDDAADSGEPSEPADDRDDALAAQTSVQPVAGQTANQQVNEVTAAQVNPVDAAGEEAQAQAQAQAQLQAQNASAQAGQQAQANQAITQTGEASQQQAAATGKHELLPGVMIAQGKGEQAVAQDAVGTKAQNPEETAAALLAAQKQKQGGNASQDQQSPGGQSQGQGSHASANNSANQTATTATQQLFDASSLEVTQAGKTVTAAPAVANATTASTSAGAQALPAGLAQLAGDDVSGDANVARIAQGLRTAINLKGGAVTIRLNPAELGAVRIEMEVKNGSVSASLQTQHASVRDLLNHQLGHLREALSGRGLVVEKLEVQSPQPSQQGQAGQDSQQAHDQGRSRGQFFNQREGSGQQQQTPGQVRNGQRSFGDMFVDMIG